MMTPVQVTRMVFIQVGGSLGPAGTRTKYGPVTHLAQTYSCTARIAPPASAHAWTGLDEARGCAYTDSESIAWIAVLWLNAVGIVSPPSCDHHTPALAPATGGTRTSRSARPPAENCTFLSREAACQRYPGALTPSSRGSDRSRCG